MDKPKMDILYVPIDQLDLSSEAKDFLSDLSISNLEEFVEIGWADLMANPKFDYVPFNRIIAFLNDRKLAYLMDKRE